MASFDPKWSRYPEYLDRLEKILQHPKSACLSTHARNGTPFTLILSAELNNWVSTMVVASEVSDEDTETDRLRATLARFSDQTLQIYENVDVSEEVVIELGHVEFELLNGDGLELEVVVAAYADHRICCMREEFALDEEFFAEQALFKAQVLWN